MKALPAKPHLLPDEVINRAPRATFAWLPTPVGDGRWCWLVPIWAWSVTQRWFLAHPVTFTLYTGGLEGGAS
ncbi:hypothetical protein CSW59_06155 [Caulobacter sp. BP25]|nr:hypothetical protein CSW59_06155 [Caulobacter sp. BP25]